LRWGDLGDTPVSGIAVASSGKPELNRSGLNQSGLNQAARSGDPFKKRRAGYTPLDHRQVFYNLSRLTAGKTQVLCILYVLQATAGVSRAAGESAPLESQPISTEEFAWFAGEKDLRTVQAALKDLCDRKVLLRRIATRGEYIYSAPVQTWEKLASFVPPKKPVDSAEALDAEDTSEDHQSEEQANSQRGNLRSNQPEPRVKIRLVPKPLALAPNQSSKAIEVPIEADIEKVQFHSNGNVQVDPVIHRGILRISIRLGAGVASNGAGPPAHPKGEAQAKARGRSNEPSEANTGPTGEMALMRDALNRWFRDRFGPVDDKIVRDAIRARGTATMQDCFGALKRRAKVIQGWGLVVEIIGDVGRAAAKAGPVSEKSYRPGEAPASTEAWQRQREIQNLRAALKFLREDPKDQHALAALEGADPALVAEARKTL
jgi:hypothetical protein